MPDVPEMPSFTDAVALPVEELALRLLAHRITPFERGGVSRHNLTVVGTWALQGRHGLPESVPEEFMRAIAEAFDWLAAKALIAREPSSRESYQSGGYFRTRLGERVLAGDDPLASIREL